MTLNVKFWLKLSLINLFIVALLGLLMRLKIGFEFPFFDQKQLLFSHYHFAFYGWISHTLMVLMAYCLAKNNADFKCRRYNAIFTVNLIAAYGMLLSFLFLGYGIVSVVFSVAAILSAYYFTFVFIKDLKRYDVNPISAKWFKAALFFNILSTLGIFALAYMMLSNSVAQDQYLVLSYYFLHFQYNGWFFFACMGLFVNFINLTGPTQLKIYRLFLIACIPAFFLSILFVKLPTWLYVIVVLSAVIQMYGLIALLTSIAKYKPAPIFTQPLILRYVLLFVGVALSIKLLLQLGSTIPVVSKLAFGFRPVVIAYLHLVLLAVISLFLLYIMYACGVLASSRQALVSLLIFTVGVLLNELVLAVQGIAAFSYTLVPYVNEMLFAVAILLAFGAGLMVYFSIFKKRPLL